MLVTTASLVVRKERIWERRESGKSLILSTAIGFLRFSFSIGFLLLFEVDLDLAIQILLWSTKSGIPNRNYQNTYCASEDENI